MILVLGGKYQGKLDFVKKNFEICNNAIFDCEKKYLRSLTYEYKTSENENAYNVIDNFETYVLTKTKEGLEPKDILADFISINLYKNTIIIADDVSMGLVPIDKIDRMYRENMGKVLSYISEHSDEVYYVLYGIAKKVSSIK